MLDYKKLITIGLEKGLKDIQIDVNESKSLKLTLYQGKLENTTQSILSSATILGIYKNKKASVFLENLSIETFNNAVEQIISACELISTKEPALIYKGSKKYPEIKEDTFDFDQIEINKKIEYIKTLEKEVLKNKLCKQVQTTQYIETSTSMIMVNSKGLCLSRKNTLAYGYALAVFEKKEDPQIAYKMEVVKDFNEFNPIKQAKETIKIGLGKLGGKPVPTNEYPVVFSSEMFSQIIDAFSSNFSAEAAIKDLTTLKDKVNTKIANENFTLIDDPLNKKAYFKYPFDNEGVACKKRIIVDKGVFKGFLHSLKTAKMFKTRPTGNNFGSVSFSNCYLKPGKTSFKSLIASLKDGIYITNLVGLHAGIQTISGDFSLQASGYKITDGKLDYAVKMIVVSGNFFKMIQDIKAIGNDLKFFINGIGSASVLINKLMISGK